MARVAKLLLIVVLCPAAVCAQGRRGGFQRRGNATGRGYILDEQTLLNLTTALLNLTDNQTQHVQTIFDAAGKTAAPLAMQIESTQDSLFDAVRAGKSDSEIKTIAAQQGALRTQILTLQAETFAKIWALLTSDQKAQADSFIYDNIGQFLSTPAPPAPPSSPKPSSPAPSGANPTAH